MYDITVEISTSIKYGAYKKHRKRAEYFKRHVISSLEWISKRFKIPKDANILIQVRPIRGKEVFGLCRPNYRKDHETTFTVDIDPRYIKAMTPSGIVFVMSVLFHELTHVEQFATGRLCWSPENGDNVSIWKNKAIVHREETHQDYLNLPWEIEAEKKAKKLALEWFERNEL